MTSPAAIWTMFIAVAAASGAAADGIGRAVLYWTRRGKPLVIEVPEVPTGHAKIYRAKKNGKGVWTRQGSDDGTDTILSGDAAYTTNGWGPLHLIDLSGFSLVAPTKDSPGVEAKTGIDLKEDKVAFKRLRIWDHAVYWLGARENDMEKLYNFKTEKEHWMVRLAPLFLIVLAGAFGLIGFVLWKVMPAIQQNTGG